MGLVHLDNSSEGFGASGLILSCCTCSMLVECPPGVGRQALHPQVHRLLLHVPWLHRRKRDCTPTLFLTSSVCTSPLTLRTTEEEGLAPLPSSSQCRGVLRRRRDWLSSSYCRFVPRRDKDRPSPSQLRRLPRRRRDRPSSSQCRYVPQRRGPGQMGRPGDTMICEEITFCTRVQVGPARDALRYHAVGVWNSRAMQG